MAGAVQERVIAVACTSVAVRFSAGAGATEMVVACTIADVAVMLPPLETTISTSYPVAGINPVMTAVVVVVDGPVCHGSVPVGLNCTRKLNGVEPTVGTDQVAVRLVLVAAVRGDRIGADGAVIDPAGGVLSVFTHTVVPSALNLFTTSVTDWPIETGTTPKKYPGTFQYGP